VRAKTLNLLQDLKDEFDLTLVMISHDLSVMYHICDRIAVMYGGRIVEIGPVERLFAKPEHPYTTTLLEAIPRIRGGSLVADELADAPPHTLGEMKGCAFAHRCRLVHDRCLVEDPELLVVDGAAGSLAACHLAGSGQP